MGVHINIALFYCLLSTLVLAQQVLGSSNSERWALLQLRASLGIRASNWPKKVDPCLNWTGIECSRDGRVTGINLSGLRRTRLGRLNPRFAIDALSNLTSLSSFNASGFSLPGPIPEWLGQKLATLQVLDLRFCGIFGSIPESFGTFSSLRSLLLSHNSITGTIPVTLGNLYSLSVLDLSQNLLTGWIPNTISRLGNLTSLDLSSNFLTGVIPLELGLLSSLTSLKLGNNSLSDSVPVQLGNLSKLEELHLGYNLLSGSLPEDLGALTNLRKLVIGKNQLEGPVPAKLLLNLSSVQYLVLKSNQFNGTFPDVLGSLRHLFFLDVSGNNFTGSLPNISAFLNGAGVFNFSNNLFYGNLSFGFGANINISLDLSRNFFTGLAPIVAKINITLNCFQNASNQRNTIDCSKFYADLNSTGNPISGSSNTTKKLKYILVGTFGGLGFIVILGVGVAYVLRKCVKQGANKRGISDVKPVPNVDSTPPPIPLYLSGLGEAFTYEQMLHATNNFSEMNLIKHGHSGDIFHGTLGDGNVVVIKRLDLQLLKKGNYTYELDLFSKIKHPRLVPIIGHCLEHENEKILVYKYMLNGDLSSSLHRVNYLEDSGLQPMDWITRLKVAIGAAEAISYLHHECNPPLVHRDIRPSSILLDDKYEVRLGSLSEVCPQGADNNQNMIARMLKLQTPDKGPSGLSSARCACDVYCFGKVLLGLITGKLDSCNSDEELENILSYISIYEKELVAKIIDESLIVDDDLLEEVWAVAIVAKSCLNLKPSARPLMRHVLRALENPFKVIREESSSSQMLRTASSRKYWSLAFLGSWRQSSSEGASCPGPTRREGTSGLKQAGRAGSQGSGGNDHSSSNKRSSSEIFPEPTDIQDIEKQDEN